MATTTARGNDTSSLDDSGTEGLTRDLPMTFALVVAVFVSFLLLFLSIFPGVLADLSFLAMLTSCVWIPALGIGGFVLLAGFSQRSAKQKQANRGDESMDEFAGVARPQASDRRLLATLIMILALNVVLFLTAVPRRLAFAIGRPAFEARIAGAASERSGKKLNVYLGVYSVDQIAADSRGGVYFRTHSGADGLGPDTMSYGFAFRPNSQGTPFGRSGYACQHLFGDWYCFEASNDY